MDMSLFSAVSSNLGAGLQIAKGMLAMKVDTEVSAKTIELQGVLSSALQRLLELQAAQFDEQTKAQDLQRRLDALLVENEKMKAFDVDAKRYELRAMDSGSFVYILKTDDEPAHWICVTCFGDRKKVILQYSRATLGGKIFACPKCKTEVSVFDGGTSGVTIDPPVRRGQMFPGGDEPY